MGLMEKPQTTFHQVMIEDHRGESFYIMKVDSQDTIAVECIEDFEPTHMEPYIEYYVAPANYVVRALASIKGSNDKVVAIYARHEPSVRASYNPILSKLVKEDVYGLGFLGCADRDLQTIRGMTDVVKQDLLVALAKTFEHQRALNVVEGHTIRRFTGAVGEREIVLAASIKRFFGDEVTFEVTYDHHNEDGSEDIYYKSVGETYFVSCHQVAKEGRMGVGVFKRAEQVQRNIDSKVQSKLEYAEALQILNGRLVNVRAATVRMLEDVVKAYLVERGYEYRTRPALAFNRLQSMKVDTKGKDSKEGGASLGECDCIFVGPYGTRYFANVELVDHSWLFIDIEVAKRTVDFVIYEEVMYKIYDTTESISD